MKERTKTIIARIALALFTLIADLIVIYSVTYILASDIPWWWSLVVLLVTGPVLYIFNKYSFISVREIFDGTV